MEAAGSGSHGVAAWLRGCPINEIHTHHALTPDADREPPKKEAFLQEWTVHPTRERKRAPPCSRRAWRVPFLEHRKKTHRQQGVNVTAGSLAQERRHQHCRRGTQTTASNVSVGGHGERVQQRMQGGGSVGLIVHRAQLRRRCCPDLLTAMGMQQGVMAPPHS